MNSTLGSVVPLAMSFSKGANSLHMSLSEKHVRQHEAAPGLVRSYLATIGRVIDEHCRI